MSFVVVVILVLGVGVVALSVFIVRMISSPRQSKAIAEALKQGRSAVVVRSAKALIAKEPHNAAAHWYLAQAYQAEGKPELALMELKAVSQIGQFGPDVPEIDFRNRIAALYERFGQVEEVADVAVMLAANGYMNGQTINVDGGWYMT